MKRRVYGILSVILFAGWCVPLWAMQKEHPHIHAGGDLIKAHEIPIKTTLLDRLELELFAELEGCMAKVGDETTSDILLATLESTFHAQVSDGVSVNLGLLWEEDSNENNIIDEGYLTLGNTNGLPLYLQAGLIYLPFGRLESAFVSDPLTLELAEIRETAAIVGMGNAWFDLNVGGFNGEYEEETADDVIGDLFASLSFDFGETFSCGAYWISDLLETDGFEAFVEGAATNGYVYETLGGAGAYASLQLGSVQLYGEYVTALDGIDRPAGVLYPQAYVLEVSMSVNDRLSGALRFEGSDDLQSAYDGGALPDRQVGAVISYAATEQLMISVEYQHAEELDDGETGDFATMQFALVL